MKKKNICSILLILICMIMTTPVFARDNQADKEYRIYIESFSQGSDVDRSDYFDQGIIRAAWGSEMRFSLAEIDKEMRDAITGSERSAYLRDGEKIVKGAEWDAVLPDGTIVKPHHIFEEVDPRHYLDEEKEKWMLEVAAFRVPFEMIGQMTVRASVEGKTVASFDVTVVGTDEYGKKVSGWRYSFKELYHIDDNGKLSKGWLRDNGKWYYLNQDGITQTGWQYLSYNGEKNWYFFSEKGATKGAMFRGWKEIEGTWYYFRSNGSMASNEWIGGYWLSKDGAWKYKAEGRWRKNSKGWWFEDERGWYPKAETVKINNVAYTFDEAGYLVEN